VTGVMASAMPSRQSREVLVEFPPLDKQAQREARSEWLNAKRTKFVADENMEPWALYLMRYQNFDMISADQAGVRHLDDRQVFCRARQLKRVLVTHDADFLNDAVFPLQTCSGLLVLPVYGAVSLEFGNLLSASASLIGRGESMWFHTKIEATRQFVLKVRTWDKAEGRITRWSFTIPERQGLRAASRRH
jgi:predicted nuclease of predicted toxin-antitoxin system